MLVAVGLVRVSETPTRGRPHQRWHANPEPDPGALRDRAGGAE
jgi:hypothetical protein